MSPSLKNAAAPSSGSTVDNSSFHLSEIVLAGTGLNKQLIEALSIYKSIDPLVRRKTVTALVGLSTATLYRLIEKGEFPRPVALTKTARAWRLSEVTAWIGARTADNSAVQP